MCFVTTPFNLGDKMWYSSGNVTCYGILFDFGCSSGISANPIGALLMTIEIIAYVVIIYIIVSLIVRRIRKNLVED